jgi:hypothetical protein
LNTLVDALPEEVVSKIWSDLGMLAMLLATVSMVPPDMLQQIEGFASAMANNMQANGGRDLGANLGALFGNAFGGVGEDMIPTARAHRPRQRRSAKKLTSQEKFRRNLV